MTATFAQSAGAIHVGSDDRLPVWVSFEMSLLPFSFQFVRALSHSFMSAASAVVKLSVGALSEVAEGRSLARSACVVTGR